MKVKLTIILTAIIQIVCNSNSLHAATNAASTSDHGLFYYIVIAFIGGLILNLMPCVLPVLMVKVFTFTKLAHESKQSTIAHSISYTSGILVSLLTLAFVVIFMKIAGKSVGWGFQFQEPLFVAAVAAICVAFAMNLFGVFEINVGAQSISSATDHSEGMKRSFFEGILAVILATPCSAPFLATAVGFALSEGALTIILVFIALGLGLACPFVLLTLIPGMSKFIPKPGPWMLRFKQFLGFALLATAIWLIWVIGRQTGVDGMLGVLVFLLAVALGSWVYGANQSAGKYQRIVAILGAVFVIAAMGMYFLQFEKVKATNFGHGALKWQAFDKKVITTKLKEGKIVFADFTADWCITCKANEKAVIGSDEVVRYINRKKIELFKADWTNGDDWIADELAKYGKAGVPMYLVFSPGSEKKPQVLPELLTVDLLLEAFKKAEREKYKKN